MNQSFFEQTYQKQWEQFRLLIDSLENKSAAENVPDIPVEEFPIHYRKLCNHYGLARARHYSPALVDNLHSLVLRGHRQLYKKKTRLVWTAIGFIAGDFPRTLRQQLLAFGFAFALFFLPLIAVGVATYQNPLLVYSVMSEKGVVTMESTYNPKDGKFGRTEKQRSETDFQMFGYYIFNNISIGFRTFASGIVFGLGSVFMLLYNGVMIGGATGYLSHPPYGSIFWQFVLGHGALELTAIVISGAAGLLLGKCLIRPGRYRRADSLRLQAPVALKLVMGAAVMFLCAAFIEAFWSSLTLPASVKYTFAGCNWTLVTLYFLFAGREKA
jgi:uncharacterized membrane protein SpoIIM required for sporulation